MLICRTVYTLQKNRTTLRILSGTAENPTMHMLNGYVDTPLFRHLGSSSWHTKDAHLILLLKDIDPKIILLVSVMVVGVLGSMIWCCSSARRRFFSPRRDIEFHSLESPTMKPSCKYT